MYRYIDVHSHVGLAMFGPDSEEVLRAMKEEGIATIVVGVDRATSEEAVALAQRHENVFATVGMHPEDGKSETFDETFYEGLVAPPRVVAVGECGLDYYRLVGEAVVGRKTQQRALFKRQIAFAVSHDKPLMLHGRPSKGTMDAYEDMLILLKEAKVTYGERLRGNAHFFVGTPEIAQRFFNIGFTISFPGVVTFSHDYDTTVRFSPQDMIHAETDSPFATPVPHRDKRNDSRYLPLIVARLAELREETEEDLRLALLKNAERVFGVQL